MISLVGIAGCGRTTSDNGNRTAPSAGAGGGGAQGGITQGGGQGGGAARSGAGGTGGQRLFCDLPTVGEAPLRRLTRFEYNNTIRDLFGDESRPADALPSSSDEVTPAASPGLVAGYHELAHEIALRVSESAASVSALIDCDPEQSGEEPCERKLLGELLPRVLRRASEPEDAAEFGAVFARGRELGASFASGVRAVLEVALQSPEFLYRAEVGEPATGSVTRPTPYEMATRLSYLLWGSTPDAELLAAAERGELMTASSVEEHARRLLADPRAKELVRHFYFRLMKLTDFDFADAASGLDIHPAFRPEVAALFPEETRRFIDDVTWNGPGNFEALLTAPFTWVNGPLASLYGIEGVGSNFQRVPLDPARRGGLLTQSSVLFSRSSQGASRPVLRGMLIVNQLMCVPVPPEPATIDVLPPPPQPASTARERLAQHSNTPSCVACHRHIDPVGLAFENYGAVGIWRDAENGVAIDASGEIYDTDAQGPFDGPMDLARKLSRSEDAKNCFVEHWMEFAYARAIETPDDCSRQFLIDAFARANGNVPELLVALTQTDAFLYLPVPGARP